MAKQIDFGTLMRVDHSWKFSKTM